ncbi:MAG: M48 family metallopeptidase [Proteobacteria bacterium]|nr:M48 family metallopeptidase [Pseudomonadota bacterium]
MMRRPLALLLSLALAFPVRAVDLPDLGDVGTSDLSTAAERRIGDEIIREIRWKDAAYLDDPEIEEYVNRLGHRLVAASDKPLQDFDFFVIKDPTLNAFALPGGHVGVHSGLILAAQSESELASVLGHEIAHVTQRHIAQIVGKQSQAGMAMLASLLIAVLAARSNSQVSEAAIAAGSAGALQSQLGYTRDYEREADRVGLQVLEGAGFDVRGMPSFFERLQRGTRLYENNAPAYLRTHPLTFERIADMENRVSSMRYRQVLDSSDFGYVQAKLRAQAGLPADAVKDLESRLAQQPRDATQRYGLARALMRAGRLDEAQAMLDKLRGDAPPSAFIEQLGAEILLARKDGAGAVRLLGTAQKRFPGSRSVGYALADAQILAGMPAAAASGVRQLLNSRGDDVRLWQLLSRADQALGKRTAQHRAQAEVYALQGSLPAAIEQLEIARREADADFYELSAVDARLRELKQRYRDEKRDKQRFGDS